MFTRALTTLSHRMVDRSSKRESSGFKSDRGYVADESKNENSCRHNTRSGGRPNKRKFDDVDKKPTKTQHIKWSPEMEYDPDGNCTEVKQKWFKKMEH